MRVRVGRGRAFQAEGIAHTMALEVGYTCNWYVENEGCMGMRKEVEQGQVQTFIFSSIGQIFVEYPLCARHKLRCISKQDAHSPCSHGSHKPISRGDALYIIMANE